MKMKIDQNPTFADAAVTTPQSDLDYINELVDWDKIAEHLKDLRTDYDELSLFKSLLLQVWYNLSDQRLAESLCRDIVFMNFCNFSLPGEKPDTATICRFRNKLQSKNIWSRLLEIINSSFEQRGLKIQESYIASDATLVPSARRPRKQMPAKENEDGIYESNEVRYSDDPDAKYVKKGKKVVYGYNSYMSANKDGLILSVGVTPANQSEMTNFLERALPKNVPKGTRILYDKGADSKKNREGLKEQGLKDGIMRRRVKGKQMKAWDKKRNKAISKRRHVIERVFGTIKRVYGFHRARYLGLEKLTGEAYLKAYAYNLRRACNLYKAGLDLQPLCIP